MMQSILFRPATRSILPVSHLLAATSSQFSAVAGATGQQLQPSSTLQKINHRHQRRGLSIKSPGPDPLEILRASSEKRQLCDTLGFRKPDVHWVFSIATAGASADEAPHLRTIDFQQVTSSGIHFIRKRGKGALALTSEGRSSSLLCSFGKYKTGENVEQWVAEGKCEQISLADELLKVIPSRSVVEIVASGIVKEEAGKASEDERTPMEKHSHFVEVVQMTRNKLDAGELTKDEIDNAVMAVRFVPSRIERMVGGPEKVMWERWQWQREADSWDAPQLLLPY